MGLPIVCSKIRGNTDLITDGVGGYLFDSKDPQSLVLALKKSLADLPEVRQSMGEVNIETMKAFDKQTVNAVMRELYANIVIG